MKYCAKCMIEAEWNTADCPICLGRLEEMEGPERHLVGESRSDGQHGGVEEAKPGRRGVGKIVGADELRRHIDEQMVEERKHRRFAQRNANGIGTSYHNGKLTALAELRKYADSIAEERSDLSNAGSDAPGEKGKANEK